MDSVDVFKQIIKIDDKQASLMEKVIMIENLYEYMEESKSLFRGNNRKAIQDFINHSHEMGDKYFDKIYELAVCKLELFIEFYPLFKEQIKKAKSLGEEEIEEVKFITNGLIDGLYCLVSDFLEFKDYDNTKLSLFTLFCYDDLNVKELYATRQVSNKIRQKMEKAGVMEAADTLIFETKRSEQISNLKASLENSKFIILKQSLMGSTYITNFDLGIEEDDNKPRSIREVTKEEIEDDKGKIIEDYKKFQNKINKEETNEA